MSDEADRIIDDGMCSEAEEEYATPCRECDGAGVRCFGSVAGVYRCPRCEGTGYDPGYGDNYGD